jgi:HK97 family phage prohead protease/HK97 family phage major capsid protein
MKDKIIKVSTGPIVCKADNGQRTIAGFASTDGLDAYNEIVSPSAFAETLESYGEFPVLLINHGWRDKPIGKVVKTEIQDHGLFVEAAISRTAEGDDAWTLIQDGVLKAFSIGFNSLAREEDDEKGIVTHTKLELLEISVVNIPANREALFQAAKSRGLSSFIATKERKPDKEVNVEPLTIKQVEQTAEDVLAKNKVGITDAAATAARGVVEPRLEALETTLESLKADAAEIGKTALTAAERKEYADKFTAIDTELGLTKDLVKKLQRPEDRMVCPDPVGDELQDFRKGEVPPEMAKMLFARPGSMGSAWEAKHERWRQLNDMLFIMNSIRTYQASVTGGGYDGPKSLKYYQEWQDLSQEFSKAMSSTSGYGGDFILTGLSSEIIRMIEQEAGIANLFATMPMPTNPFEIPYISAHTTAYRYNLGQGVDFPTEIPLSEFTTGKRSMTAVGFGAGTHIDADVLEDSLIAVLPEILADFARVWARTWDDAVINGDASATHRDTGFSITASAYVDHRTAWDGLRHQANADSAELAGNVINAPLTADFEAADLIRMLQEMGSVATPARIADIVFLMTLKKYWTMQLFPERLTVDKAGDGATILRGPNDRIFGIQAIPTEFMRDDYTAAGLYTGTGTSGLILAVYRPAWKWGVRRALLVETQKNIKTQQIETVSTCRRVLKMLRARSATYEKVVYALITVPQIEG